MSDAPGGTVADRPLLGVTGVGKALTSADGDIVTVNENIDLALAAGEFVSVVGPSGAGKTTLLRTLSGLTTPDTGVVSHHGEPMRGVPPWLAIVFQEYNKTLFPWLSVGRNVRLGARELPRGEAEERVARVLAGVGLEGQARRYPWELSGGMQQRVALARAIIGNPELLLMDEPFASVDALTRAKLEDVVLELWERIGFAALLVTHDIGEAIYLSDRVLVMSQRPSTIIAELPVDLPRPREQSTTRALPAFHALHDRVLGLVEDAGSAPADRP